MKIYKWKGNTKLHGIFLYWIIILICKKYQVRGEYCCPFDEMMGTVAVDRDFSVSTTVPPPPPDV